LIILALLYTSKVRELRTMHNVRPSPRHTMVYCKGCRHVFPEYQVIGQRIKDSAPHPLTAVPHALGLALSVYVDGPLASMLSTQNWESLLSLSDLNQIHSGSRRDALNFAKFPCPICGGFVKWKRGHRGKGSVIRPGDLDWRGGSNRFLLEYVSAPVTHAPSFS